MFEALKHESLADFLWNHWLLIVVLWFLVFTAVSKVVRLFRGEDVDAI